MSDRDDAFYEIFDKRRRDWDYDEDPVTFTRTLEFIDTAEIHHTGTRGPRSLSFEHKRRWLLAIERAHEVFNSWSDIFYHVFVFADGEVWEGRDARRTSQGNIPRALTIHLPGNNPIVTAPQYASLLRVVRWAADQPHRVRDHQMRPASTECAGERTRRDVIPRLRQDLLMTDHTHEYQDLGQHPDATQAQDKGFWNGVDPTLAASRSTLAVVANRVDVAARGRERALAIQLTALGDTVQSLARRVDALAEQIAELDRIGNVIEIDAEALEVIVNEIIARLDNG